MDILHQLSTNPYVTLSGWAATIAALILCIIFYNLQKKRRVISYSYQTNLLVSDKLSEVDDLNIIYKGKAIEKLSITSIEIVNSGNALIEDDDIYPQQKLKIESEDNVLFAKRTFQSSETIESDVELQEKEIIIKFKALEKKEKIIINIYHTGNPETKFNVTGKIKDGGKIIVGKPFIESIDFNNGILISSIGIMISIFAVILIKTGLLLAVVLILSVSLLINSVATTLVSILAHDR